MQCITVKICALPPFGLNKVAGNHIENTDLYTDDLYFVVTQKSPIIKLPDKSHVFRRPGTANFDQLDTLVCQRFWKGQRLCMRYDILRMGTKRLR